MKILVLSSQAKNTGSAMRAEAIYKYLKKAGAQASYITPPFNSMPFMFDFLLTLFCYFFMLLNKKFDIVLIVKPYPNTVLPALMLKLKGAKIIIDIDDLDYGYRKGFLSGIIKYLQNKLTPVAWRLTSHNDELIKLIKKEFPLYEDKVYKLKQGVDLSLFSGKAVNKKEVNNIKNSYPDREILFYMANLNIGSYLEDIIKAIMYLKKKNIILLVAGGGPLLKYYTATAIKNGVKDKIVFLGDVRRAEICNYIAAAGICLVYYRNLPVNKCRASMKLREYLALNKPVVANKVGEILGFEDYMYLSPVSTASFAREIKKRLTKLDNRGEKGYKFIVRNFNWEKEARIFYEYLKSETAKTQGSN